jgi:organic hydroperoxide reductase OsmC/OhrA
MNYMQKYPIQFTAAAEATDAVNATWMIVSGANEALCAVPPEFDGPGGGFSPEDFFAQALTNCFLATFKVYATNSKLQFAKIKAHGQLEVDLNEERKPVMKTFTLQVVIKDPSNVERAKLLGEKAMRSGFILNSVKTELKFEWTVEGETADPAQ